MKATVENINMVQRRIKVSIPVESVQQAFDSAYKRLQKKSNIKGFRKGKAPISIIKQSYGASVAGEVGETLINNHLFTAIQENDVKPIAPPMVESASTPDSAKEYEFSAIVDVMPEIEVKGYKELSVSCNDYTYNEKSIDKELKMLARRQAKTQKIEGEDVVAKKENMVVISHTATMDGKPLPEMASENINVALGQEEIFPELEKGIIGMKLGESKEITLDLPKDFGAADLAGKTVTFNITLNEVMSLELPTLDDEFAKDMNYESIADLRAKIDESLKQNVEKMRKSELENALMDALRAKNEFDVPPTMADQVIDGMVSEMGIQDKKMKQQALADTELRNSMLPEAKKRVQNTILLWEIAKAENIEISDDDVKNHIKGFINANAETADSQIEKTIQSMGERIKENLLLEKSMDVIINNAKIANIPKEI